MKSWEWEKIFVERGRTEGRAEGRTEGRTEGRAEGLEQGRFLLLCEMVQSGDISLEKASGKMDLLPEKFADRMKEAGYV